MISNENTKIRRNGELRKTEQLYPKSPYQYAQYPIFITKFINALTMNVNKTVNTDFI